MLARLPEATVHFVGASATSKRTEDGMLALGADLTLEELPVPGGRGTRALLGDAQMLGWLRVAHERSRWTTSVCTGSLLLAAAGLLDGLEATTHWLAFDLLASLGAKPVTRRVVEHPRARIMTAAGVAAGIDMALGLAARIVGDDVAQAIQLAIEYDPEPPFAAGSPVTAPPAAVARVGDGTVRA